MQWMPGKKRRDHRAPPQRVGHSFQDEEEQHGIGGVQEQVDGVRTAWLEAEALAVQHVRHPGDRMPIGAIARLKAPDQPAPAQTVLQVGISKDI